MMSSLFAQQDHGGAHGLEFEGGLDLSVNLNPYGPPPDLLEHLRALSIRSYPDPEARLLRQQIADRLGEAPDAIAIGNGANELLWAAARAFIQAGQAFACVEPCYSEFTRAALAAGGLSRPLRLLPHVFARCSSGDLIHHIDQHDIRVLYLCNPNSPTGAYLSPDLLKEVSEARPRVAIILDESFLSLSHQHAARDERYPANCLRLVSLTKDFALAGLRLGYARGAADRIAALRAQIPNWSVNTLALEAGSWCFAHEEFLERTRPQLLREAAALADALEERSLAVLPSQTIFCLCAPPDPLALAQRLLERHRILVRSCASYGYPNYWRIAARPAHDLQRFLQALDQELAWKY